MRMMIIAKNPPEPFNSGVKDGSSGKKLKAILEEIKPELAFFTEIDGKRCTVMIVDMKDASQIPALAEPFFLSFNSAVSFHPVMSPEDLGKAGLEDLGKKWG